MSQGLAYRAGLLFLADRKPNAETPETVRWQGQYYQWDGHLYRPLTDEAMEAAAAKWLARNPTARASGNKTLPVTRRFLQDMLLAVRTETTIDDDKQLGTWIRDCCHPVVGPFLATPDGILDLGRLNDPDSVPLPASSNFFTLTALPVTPAAAAECPVWKAFLEKTFRGTAELILLLQEAFGYCMWPDCRFEKFFVFHGQGNTGKSTVAETLLGVLGDANVCALPLDRFRGQFSLISLTGKTANVVFDASDIEKSAEGTLKALVSGEPVTVEPKHKPVATRRLSAKHIIIANQLPKFHDTSDGLWRRLELIPFENVCPKHERDPGLKERLRAELPAIARWALEGLARLLQQNGFTPFARGQKLLAEYRSESNPVSLFLGEHCVPDANARISRQAVYARYKGWANTNGHAPVSATRFNREVRNSFPQPEQEIRDGHGGDRMFIGFRLRKPTDVLQEFRLLAEKAAEAG